MDLLTCQYHPRTVFYNETHSVTIMCYDAATFNYKMTLNNNGPELFCR